MFIKANSAWINIELACELLELSRSYYYEWIANCDRQRQQIKQYYELSQCIVNLFTKFKQRYGAGRIVQELEKLGIKSNRKKVATIMRENNLIPCGYKKYKVITTKSNHKYKVFDNLLKRNFIIDKPNQIYVSDITYIRTDEGWLYLATVIDLFSRKLIGYKMSNRMTKDLVIGALQNALQARGYPNEVIIHSDRGSQYSSNEYKQFLKHHHLVGSMSRKGDCWDNAVAESFFATLKKEYIYQTRFKTRVCAQLGIFDYIETWYNKERIHSFLDNLSPNQFEEINQYKFITKTIKNVNIKNYEINTSVVST